MDTRDEWIVRGQVFLEIAIHRGLVHGGADADQFEAVIVENRAIDGAGADIPGEIRKCMEQVLITRFRQHGPGKGLQLLELHMRKFGKRAFGEYGYAIGTGRQHPQKPPSFKYTRYM